MKYNRSKAKEEIKVEEEKIACKSSDKKFINKSLDVQSIGFVTRTVSWATGQIQNLTEAEYNSEVFKSRKNNFKEVM